MKRHLLTLAAAALLAAIVSIVTSAQVGYFAKIAVSDTQAHTVPVVASDTLALLAAAQTFTNKTVDAEATGNVVTIPWRIWLRAGTCQNVTAATDWDLPTTNPAVAACSTGTNTQKGTLDFADGANSLSAQTGVVLPADFSGAIDVRLKWFAGTAITGAVVWQVATVCVADAETSDPAFSTASTVTDTVKGTVNQDNDAAITGVTATTCAAGELMYLKVFRDPAHVSDTMADTARLRGLELTYRRAL